MSNKNRKSNVTKIKPKKKSTALRIFIVAVAAALLLGIIILPFQSFAEDMDGVSIVVDEFETGKLSEAINEALDGTDFNHVTNLAVLSGTLSSSDYQALLNIPNLKNIELAGTETENGVIPENAIPSRNQLTYISLPKNTEEIGSKAFSNNKKLVKISMPNTVKKIGSYAFEACEALEAFPVNENITYIGEGAFKDCKSITEFVIPSNITEIYAYTFSKCGFSEIIIGPNVKSIGDGAFADCNTLKDIYVYTENAPEISNSGVFQNVGASIHVYEDSADSFKSWEGNNIKTAGDLTGEYPLSTAAPVKNEDVKESSESSSSDTVQAENDNSDNENIKETVSNDTDVKETSQVTSEKADNAVPAQAETVSEKSSGINIVVVIIIAVVCLAGGFASATIIMKKKQ